MPARSRPSGRCSWGRHARRSSAKSPAVPRGRRVPSVHSPRWWRRGGVARHSYVSMTCARPSTSSRCSRRSRRRNDRSTPMPHGSAGPMNWYERIISLQITWRHVIDIVVVAVVIYNGLALIRGTRAMQVSIGLFVLVSSFFVARAFDLPALEAISRQMFFYLPFAIIVLFQHEIRRALARMGGNPLLALFRPSSAIVTLGAIVQAADVLAAKKIGALIAIERTQSLRSYAEGAKQLDAVLTSDLLVTIF